MLKKIVKTTTFLILSITYINSIYSYAGDLSLKSYPGVKSSSAIVFDQNSRKVIFGKNSERITPIASITKLMTAMVILDSEIPLLKEILITKDDIDRYKLSKSKLKVGSKLMRAELLKLSLMASENRAASALARTYPGGTLSFVRDMNIKARKLGMLNTVFVDSTGLRPGNVSTAADLVRLVAAASGYPIIKRYTTTSYSTVKAKKGLVLQYVNSNRLVGRSNWDIGISKTGYIREAGRCLVMQTNISSRPLIIILLDSWGKLTRIGDANRIKKWIEKQIDFSKVQG